EEVRHPPFLKVGPPVPAGRENLWEMQVEVPAGAPPPPPGAADGFEGQGPGRGKRRVNNPGGGPAGRRGSPRQGFFIGGDGTGGGEERSSRGVGPAGPRLRTAGGTDRVAVGPWPGRSSGVPRPGVRAPGPAAPGQLRRPGRGQEWRGAGGAVRRLGEARPGPG